MKKIILICLTTLLACNIKAQMPNIDSLVNVLETHKLTAAEQFKLYDKICRIYKENDLEKFLFYANKGLQLAEKEKEKNQVSIFTKYKGEYYFYKNIYDTAFVCYEKALALSIENEDKETEAIIYGSIGNIYNMQEKDSLALYNYMQALSIFEDLGKKRNQIGILCNISEIHQSKHNYERALYFIEKAKVIVEEMDDPSYKMVVYFELGSIHQHNKEYDLALEYFLKVIDINRYLGNNNAEIASLNNIAYIYCAHHKDFDKAEKYALESLHIAKEFGNPSRLNDVYSILSNVYLYQKRYKESDELATKAWETDTTNLSIGTRNNILNIVYSNIYLGNKEKAKKFLEKFIYLIDNNIEKDYKKNLSEMEVKYETEKKEMRIVALEKEKTLYMWIITVSIIAALLAFGILFYRHKLNVQKRKHAEQQIKQLEQEKQLVAAQAVIDGEAAERSRLARDLHDGLGGMLSVVKLNLKDMKGYSILDNLDADHFGKAMEMLDQSINELRRVAHHIMPESLMRYGLKTSLDDFCRAIPGTHFHFFGDDAGLDNRLKILIYRCAYELVNNAVKHAGASNINVQLMIENGLISLSIHDDGAGFDPEKVTEGSGLENVRIRVASYNGKMNIYSSPGKGTEVSIEIEPS
jgi:signal transduction histidine kinase